MKKAWNITRVALELWGAFCLICFVVIGLAFGAVLSDWLCTKKSFADKDDVTFILNAGGIGGKARVIDVIHSYRSPRSFGGDHRDAYCIKLDHFPQEVLRTSDDCGQILWLIGPVTNALLKEAIDNAFGSPECDAIDWFPSVQKINSERFYLSFVRVSAAYLMVDRVKMLAWDREQELLFFSDASW